MKKIWIETIRPNQIGSKSNHQTKSNRFEGASHRAEARQERDDPDGVE